MQRLYERVKILHTCQGFILFFRGEIIDTCCVVGIINPKSHIESDCL